MGELHKGYPQQPLLIGKKNLPLMTVAKTDAFSFNLSTLHSAENVFDARSPKGDVSCWSFTFHRLIPLPNTALVNIAVIGFLSKKINWNSK